MTPAPDRADRPPRPLTDYPRPSVAVDTALLTIVDGSLGVLVVRPANEPRGEWRLPGTFLHEGETLADAVRRSLAQKAGIHGIEPRQLHVFDDPARDDRGWVLSVAHAAATPAERIPAEPRTRVAAVDRLGELSPMKFDHDDIVRTAIARIRDDYAVRPDPWHLLRPGSGDADETEATTRTGAAGGADAAAEPAGSFTVLELRTLHEAVLGRPLVRDTFRRAMLLHLEPTGRVRRGTRGKPAELYLRA